MKQDTNTGINPLYDQIPDEDKLFARLMIETIGMDGMRTMTKYQLKCISELELTQLKVIDEFKSVGCDRCGQCCKANSAELTDEDIIRMCKHLDVQFDEFYNKYMDKSHITNCLLAPCPFLGEDGCRIYNVRPDICRTYPFSDNTMEMHPCKLGKYIYDEIVKACGECDASDEDGEQILAYAKYRNRIIDSGRVPHAKSHDSAAPFLQTFVTNDHLNAVLKMRRKNKHAENEMRKFVSKSFP